MMRLLHLGALVALLLALLVIVGCGGTGSSTPTPPPPTGDTGTLTGRVVEGDNVNIGISGATVSVLSQSGSQLASGTADSTGSFTLSNVPVGLSTVQVDTANEANYGSQTVPGITVSKNAATSLTVPVVPAIDATPNAVYLSPSQATLDLHGKVTFQGAVVSSSGTLAVTPLFMVSKNIGVIDAHGNFTATGAGKGQIVAICGDATVTADVVVTDPRSPQITTYLVAPVSLKASGGNTTITIAANDGDGIKSVEAHIYRPGGEDIRTVPFVAGSTDTYRLLYAIPANSNEPDGSGNQASQRYSIQVLVTDSTNAVTSSGFVDVIVAGLDSPPPPG